MHHAWSFYVVTALSQFKNTDWLSGCNEGYLAATCVTNCDKDLSANGFVGKEDEAETETSSFAPTKGPMGGRGGVGWRLGSAAACSPHWGSGFYNWRLPHHWCCSTEGSRHLYMPVGTRVIA